MWSGRGQPGPFSVPFTWLWDKINELRLGKWKESAGRWGCWEGASSAPTQGYLLACIALLLSHKCTVVVPFCREQRNPETTHEAAFTRSGHWSRKVSTVYSDWQLLSRNLGLSHCLLFHPFNGQCGLDGKTELPTRHIKSSGHWRQQAIYLFISRKYTCPMTVCIFPLLKHWTRNQPDKQDLIWC